MSSVSLEDRSGPGFFIPYRHADGVRPIAYEPCRVLFGRAQNRFDEWLAIIETYCPDFDRFGGTAPAPRFEQDWFVRLDIMACYAMIRTLTPKRVIEVGSGHSTRVMARAVEDGRLATELICIDPKPRATIAELKVQHIPKLVGALDAVLFSQLGEGDVLFVDSSHLAQPGTDVDFLLNNIVPMLKKGAIIHIHDICLPDAYPDNWAWRGYNEQIVVAAMLTSGAFEPLFSSHYIVNHTNLLSDREALANYPKRPDAIETSLWLRKCSNPIV